MKELLDFEKALISVVSRSYICIMSIQTKVTATNYPTISARVDWFDPQQRHPHIVYYILDRNLSQLFNVQSKG